MFNRSRGVLSWTFYYSCICWNWRCWYSGILYVQYTYMYSIGNWWSRLWTDSGLTATRAVYIIYSSREMNALYYSPTIKLLQKCGRAPPINFIPGETTTGCGKSCLKIDFIIIHFARKCDIFTLSNNGEKITVAMVTYVFYWWLFEKQDIT